jgi:hypothetical protein
MWYRDMLLSVGSRLSFGETILLSQVSRLQRKFGSRLDRTISLHEFRPTDISTCLQCLLVLATTSTPALCALVCDVISSGHVIIASGIALTLLLGMHIVLLTRFAEWALLARCSRQFNASRLTVKSILISDLLMALAIRYDSRKHVRLFAVCYTRAKSSVVSQIASSRCRSVLGTALKRKRGFTTRLISACGSERNSHSPSRSRSRTVPCALTPQSSRNYALLIGHNIVTCWI